MYVHESAISGPGLCRRNEFLQQPRILALGRKYEGRRLCGLRSADQRPVCIHCKYLNAGVGRSRVEQRNAGPPGIKVGNVPEDQVCFWRKLGWYDVGSSAGQVTVGDKPHERRDSTDLK